MYLISRCLYDLYKVLLHLKNNTNTKYNKKNGILGECLIPYVPQLKYSKK